MTQLPFKQPPTKQHNFRLGMKSEAYLENIREKIGSTIVGVQISKTEAVETALQLASTMLDLATLYMDKEDSLYKQHLEEQKWCKHFLGWFAGIAEFRYSLLDD